MTYHPTVQRRPDPRSSSWQRRLVGLALSALLAAQWLALVHGVVHRGVGSAPQDSLQAPAVTLTQTLLKAVTGHDEKSPACQLFDQLAQSSPLGMTMPALAADPAPQAVPDVPAATPRAAAPSPYCARAPPVLA